MPKGSPEVRRPGYRPKFQPQYHGEKMFDLSGSVDDFIEGRNKRSDSSLHGHHQRFADDDDEQEDNGAGDGAKDNKPQAKQEGVRDDPSSSTRTRYLTTSNVPRSDQQQQQKKNSITGPDQKIRSSRASNGGSTERDELNSPKGKEKFKPMFNSDLEDQHSQMESPQRHRRHAEDRSSPDFGRHPPSQVTPRKHQLKSPMASPLSLRRPKGTTIDMPSVSSSAHESLSPPPPSSPSVRPRMEARSIIVSPKTIRKSTKLIETMKSPPDLPETEEEYDALDHRTKMRLGDEIKIRRMIRDRQGSANYSSSQDSSRDRVDGRNGDGRRDKEMKKGRLQDHSIYRAQHADLRRGRPVSESDSDLEDVDPFKAYPLGTKAREVPLELSALPALPARKCHDYTERDKASSSSTTSALKSRIKVDIKESEADFVEEIVPSTSDFGHDDTETKDFQRRKKDSHQQGMAKVGSSDKKLTAIRVSKPLVVRDEDRPIFAHLFGTGSPAPIKTMGARGKGQDVSTTELQAVSKNGKEEKERLRKADERRSLDFFNLGQNRSTMPTASSSRPNSSARKGDGIAVGKVRRTPSPSPISCGDRDSKEQTMKSKSISRAARFTQQRKSSTISSASARHSNAGDSSFDALVLKESSESESNGRGGDAQTFDKKRRKSVASDSSAEEDSRLTTPTRFTPSRFGTPSRTAGEGSEKGSDSHLLKSPQARAVPKAGDRGFQLPSPSKKRPRMVIPSEVMFLSDDDIPDTVLDKNCGSEDTCPYCGDALPKNKSKRLSTALAKVLMNMSRSAHSQQQHRRESSSNLDLELTGTTVIQDLETPLLTHNSLTFEGEGPDEATNPKKTKRQPRPRGLHRARQQANLKINDGTKVQVESAYSSSIEIVDDDDGNSGDDANGRDDSIVRSEVPSWIDKYEFCRIHIYEETIVPQGTERDYPLHINFSELPGRVAKMKEQLRGVIERRVPSTFLDRALSNYERMGTLGARNPHVLLANVEHTMPGYYGSRGSEELSKILVRFFLETNILTRELAQPQKPIEYIEQVLVPEAGLRLIAEDRRNLRLRDEKEDEDASLEEALEIMRDSVAFGTYIHDNALHP
ncbi:hypothetical protein BGZ58_000762 [Dissophora ornata]|nr:hypothetical protein BGZ58_000762 [Dissophora ornata]